MKRPFFLLLLILLLPACGQPVPVVLPTPTPAAAPTCYVIVDVTSAALYSVAFVPTPASDVYVAGQVVETAVTGGVVKWSQLEICGNLQRYVDDFERTIRIELGERPLLEVVCQEETCPLTFTIPSDTPPGRTQMVVYSGRFSGEYEVVIQEAATPSP
ncbi:MAG: hypothetical protein H6658_09440 [Ardenticatenaceae bacterium]|nr:hypothetical protein [Ardenticatenaceae bacterium]